MELMPSTPRFLVALLQIPWHGLTRTRCDPLTVPQSIRKSDRLLYEHSTITPDPELKETPPSPSRWFPNGPANGVGIPLLSGECPMQA